MLFEFEHHCHGNFANLNFPYIQEVKLECFKWAQSKDAALDGTRELSEFNPSLIWQEMCMKAPLLMEALKAATDIRKDRRTRRFKEKQQNHLIMCAAIILNMRASQKFTFMQLIVGAMLYDGHASKRVL